MDKKLKDIVQAGIVSDDDGINIKAGTLNLFRLEAQLQGMAPVNADAMFDYMSDRVIAEIESGDEPLYAQLVSIEEDE